MIPALIVPAILVTLLGINYYWLPVGNSERSNFLALIILTDVMFLVLLRGYLPISRNTPILGELFLGYVIILCIMSVCVVFLEARIRKLKLRLEDVEKRKSGDNEK